MRCLRPFLEREDVRAILAGCRESKAVQGVNVRLSWRWVWAWRIGERFDPYHPQKGYDAHWRALDLLPPRWGGGSSWLPIRPPQPKDLDWQPEGDPWFGPPGPPIIMSIRLYPSVMRRGEAPTFNIQANNFQLVYEACPLARLYAGPQSTHRPVIGGTSIGVNPTDNGTLGGVLRDDAGKYYGITCGHVAQNLSTIEQPSQADGGGGSGSSIGKVIHAELPPAFPSYLPQTRKNQSKHAGRVDISIFEINGVSAKQEILNLGTVKDVFPVDDLEQDHRLELTGRTSDWKVLEYGGVTPYHNLHNTSTGDVYCYEDPLMLRDSGGAQPVQPGDSGAWVCAPSDNGYSWAGMVVGGDGQVGFAVSAEALKSWWEDAPRGMTLLLT
jgi:hypothetical protein